MFFSSQEPWAVAGMWVRDDAVLGQGVRAGGRRMDLGGVQATSLEDSVIGGRGGGEVGAEDAPSDSVSISHVGW